MSQGGISSHFVVNFYRTYELVIIDSHDMWHIMLLEFFPTKTMDIIKIHFEHIRWENTAPGTKFAYYFFAGVSPLQLDVLLVF